MNFFMFMLNYCTCNLTLQYQVFTKQYLREVASFTCTSIHMCVWYYTLCPTSLMTINLNVARQQGNLIFLGAADGCIASTGLRN